jgi:hypothetical protein
MRAMSLGSTLALVAYAAVGSALCAAVIAVGRQVVSLETALIVHALAAPLIFAGLAFRSFGRVDDVAPLQAATLGAGVVILLDVAVAALVVERGFAMFGGGIGTWLPFASIFAVIHVVGRETLGRVARRPVARP